MKNKKITRVFIESPYGGGNGDVERNIKYARACVYDSFRKGEIMSQNVNNGICATCNFATSCTTLKNATNPIWFCEMFDDTLEHEKKENQKLHQQPSPVTGFIDKNQSKFKGLCMNCANRETCKIASTEGGIWHCAEYI